VVTHAGRRLTKPDDLSRYARPAQDDGASVTGGLFDVALRPWDVALTG